MDMDLGDLAAVVALGLSAYSIWTTNSFNRRQKTFIETNERLTQLLIEKESSESVAQKRADVSADFWKAGKHDWRLKIYNKGQGTARNVRMTVLDDSDLFLDGDIARKLPTPILERHQSVELIAAVDMGSPSRVHIRLEWDDDAGSDWAKELTPVLP